jgi:hypothetical protein
MGRSSKRSLFILSVSKYACTAQGGDEKGGQ